jgi:acetylornithine/N-succinyldiaminopimelate aminotransferase
MCRLDIPAVAARAGERLRDGLLALDAVTEVRGLGLLLAAELDVDSLGRDSKAVAADLLGRGLVVNAVTPSALRFAPPLTVTDPEIDEAVALVGDVLAGRSA